MPDADIIYADVDAGYKGAYKLACAGLVTSEELARKILSALKKDLKSCGDGPYQLIGKTVRLLATHYRGPLFNQTIDWKGLRREVDKRAQEISKAQPDKKRYIAIAVESCYSIVNEIENGAVIDADDLEFQCVRTFMGRTRKANFEERVPLVTSKSAVDPEELLQRLSDASPHVEKGVDYFAGKYVCTSDINSIRLPRRVPGVVKSIGIDDDLLNLGVN